MRRWGHIDKNSEDKHFIFRSLNVSQGQKLQPQKTAHAKSTSGKGRSHGATCQCQDEKQVLAGAIQPRFITQRLEANQREKEHFFFFYVALSFMSLLIAGCRSN